MAIIAFVETTDGQCCKLNANLAALAAQLHNSPITIVQISEPVDKCPYGPACIARCHFQDPHLVSLCDGDRSVWKKYQKPQPNTVVLLEPRGKVAQVAPLTDLATVAIRARSLAAGAGGW